MHLHHLAEMYWKALSTESPPGPPQQEFQQGHQRKASEVYQPQYLAQPLLAGDGWGNLHWSGCKENKNKCYHEATVKRVVVYLGLYHILF